MNPCSSRGPDARAALVQAGVFEVVDLEHPTVRSQIESVLAGGAKRVLVAGGDGTLGTAAAACIGRGTELAILAAGTLNHFARDHGIPEDAAEAIGAALGEATSPVDVGVVSDHVFLNTASVGMYVRYVRTRERFERYVGYRLASAAALVATFLRHRRISVELQVEGETRHYRTPMLFVGVGERELKAPKFGGRVRGGCRGLHVMIVRGRRPARLLTTALAAAARGVAHASASPDIDTFVVESCTVRVRGRRSLTIGLDGELIGVATLLEFRIARDALRVVGALPPAHAMNEASP
ncbi:MAG TPA: diacylglycerol kinase family protein [Gemmatimonadaceae bacterium]|nr:diacylglycerol kinase family protein [Gemmatimonadaceae bacterium]